MTRTKALMQCEFGIIFWRAVRRAVEEVRAMGGHIEHAERFTGFFKKEFIFEGDHKSLRLLSRSLGALNSCPTD